MSVYVTSPIKRKRATKAQMEARSDALLEILAETLEGLDGGGGAA